VNEEPDAAPRYTVEYDSRLDIHRRQLKPGHQLGPPNRQSISPSVRLVAMGGGTGLPILLQGLKAVLFPPRGLRLPAGDSDRLTAIVTTADDGGSSGRHRWL
jgi:2-phospho-L-lactate transferase CofD